ncbi:MAG: helix-turn-helix domain-containing protein [Ruminococcaceae bacterium]|nr:helix-turn-helix domain-containing protein [Oscillospiraceae bacterium]
MNDILFCNSFRFKHFFFTNYKHTDNTHGVTCHYFGLMVKGHGKICMQGETVTIQEGDLFFLPNGCQYQSHWYGTSSIEFISLGFGFLPNFENRYYVTQVLPANSEATALMHDIICSPLNCVTVGKFYTLVGILLSDMIYQSLGTQCELIDKATRRIATHPYDTVEELAKHLAVSESTLYTAFKNHSKASIHEIKRHTIMEKAKELLVSTDTPIEEISQRLHFSSSSYFRKCFKAFYGVSPRELRKQQGI